MKTIEQIEEEMRKLADELEVVRKKEEGPKLRLEVSSIGSLHIKYGEGLIGLITVNGRCNILNDSSTVETYEKWRENGMKVDSTPIEWRGGMYQITDSHDLVRRNYTGIYDFDGCQYYARCKDENIKRFKHNGKAIGF